MGLNTIGTSIEKLLDVDHRSSVNYLDHSRPNHSGIHQSCYLFRIVPRKTLANVFNNQPEKYQDCAPKTSVAVHNLVMRFLNLAVSDPVSSASHMYVTNDNKLRSSA